MSPRYAEFAWQGIYRVHMYPQIPANVTTDQAATLPLGLNTAVFGLYNHEDGQIANCGLFPPWEEGGQGKYAGKPILVFGGASSVGQYGKHPVATIQTSQ